MHQRLQLTKSEGKVKSASSAGRVQTRRSGSGPVEQIHHLQRTVGNQSVQRLLASGQLQAQLTVNETGDKYEQEADRVADQVMRMPDSAVVGAAVGDTGSPPTIQRKCTACSTGKGTRIQRQESGSPGSSETEKKPELAFYSNLHIFPGEMQRAGDQYGVWWMVWNPGWVPAGPHTNLFTLYRIHDCFGCRRDEDIVMLSSIFRSGLDSLIQKGDYYYKDLVILPPLEEGDYCGYVDLDVDDEVDELDESNNTLDRCFRVYSRDESEESD